MHGKFTTMQKGAIVIKTPMAIFKIQMRKKIFFLWRRLRLDLIFTSFRTFFLVFFYSGLYFLWSYFLRLYWQPHTILGNKSQESKTQDFISSDIFFQGLEKIRTFFLKFLFPGFFSRNFFPGTFLHRYLTTMEEIFLSRHYIVIITLYYPLHFI